MSTLDDIRDTLERLKTKGWRELLAAFDFDVDATDLRGELLKPLQIGHLQRAIPGFEELSLQCKRAIEPGKPAESLLFHALSSPAVQVSADGSELGGFPSVRDLETVENLVYAIAPANLEDLIADLGDSHLAIAVFAREYRQRKWTVHGAHADVVYSRTGVTHVGTLAPHWDGRARSFSPIEPGDAPFGIRAQPCRYAVYIAAQMRGKPEDFGPFRGDRSFAAARRFSVFPQSRSNDSELDFWVPVHKLFSGADCLSGQDLDIRLMENHVNEKLRRIHLANMGEDPTFDSGFSSSEIDSPPFVVREGLADFLDPQVNGDGVLCATPREKLIEATKRNNQAVGVAVPSQPTNRLAPSFTIPARRRPNLASGTAIPGRAHWAPEWMHVRTWLKPDRSEENLNKRSDVADIVRSAQANGTKNYVARHYTDFTADGWLSVTISGLPRSRLARQVPAYSVIAAPDFYPYVSQSDLLDWSLHEVPTSIRERLWAVPPLALCDQRTAPNLSLRSYGAPFRPEDVTVSAIVGQRGSASRPVAAGSSQRIDRISYLPDAAAGYYAPGWDTSTDYDDSDGAWHLAAYGLGSPFPEDAKLCAALSAFWPAVAPDSARSSDRRPIAPMTDREVGLEDVPAWDGIVGPRRVVEDGRDYFETDDFDHVDYVYKALEGHFSLSETAKVTQNAYQARILATNLASAALNNTPPNPLRFRLLSFKEADAADPEFQAALEPVPDLSIPAHKLVMVRTGQSLPKQRDPSTPERWLARAEILETVTLFVDDAGHIAMKRDPDNWKPGV